MTTPVTLDPGVPSTVLAAHRRALTTLPEHFRETSEPAELALVSVAREGWKGRLRGLASAVVTGVAALKSDDVDSLTGVVLDVPTLHDAAACALRAQLRSAGLLLISGSVAEGPQALRSLAIEQLAILSGDLTVVSARVGERAYVASLRNEELEIELSGVVSGAVAEAIDVTAWSGSKLVHAVLSGTSTEWPSRLQVHSDGEVREREPEFSSARRAAWLRLHEGERDDVEWLRRALTLLARIGL